MRSFTCAHCHGTFDTEVPIEEVRDEYESHFGTFRQEEVASVCDDCFNQMHPEKHPHLVETSMARHVRERRPKPKGVGPYAAGYARAEWLLLIGLPLANPFNMGTERHRGFEQAVRDLQKQGR